MAAGLRCLDLLPQVVLGGVEVSHAVLAEEHDEVPTRNSQNLCGVSAGDLATAEKLDQG